MDRETIIHNLLERILLDENEEPTKLPMWLLESMTNSFSEDMKIGDGGSAHVYKGVFRNHSVAVKKLKHSEKVDLQEAKFIQEVDSLMRVKHTNIVRFLGYCSDTQGNMQKHQGKNIMAEERQRFLCFEFMPQGSLDKYVSDASTGLDWRTRYQIIKGICNGLHYLHDLRIVHLDLKPENILLDHHMVPKITDFGISKRFDEKQTRAVTSNPYGSLGYMAPEFYDGVITFKSDIYSLGRTIIEILTGRKGYPEVENVLESWSTRFQKLQDDPWLEHVRVCAEIGLECVDSNPVKRPEILRIISRLDELEQQYGVIGIGLSATHPTPRASASGARSWKQAAEFGEKPGLGAAEVESSGDGKLVQFDRPLAFSENDLHEASAEMMGTSTSRIMYDDASLKGGSQLTVESPSGEITKGDKELPLGSDDNFHPTISGKVNGWWKSFKTYTRGVLQPTGRSYVGVKLVHFDRPLAFTADDMLEASAEEMMGKGIYGMTYKVTPKGGSLVAVKRLKEDITKGDKQFETGAAVLGRIIGHPNLLALRAYLHSIMYREKLLLFDYMPKGSLNKLLHGRPPNKPHQDWATRMSIAKGTARGLTYLHDDMDIAHGNLTASNVLMDEQNNPMISEFGLFRLIAPEDYWKVQREAVKHGYCAPELFDLSKANTKTDVYSLGVIILELLTGKSPAESIRQRTNLTRWVASAVKEGWTREVFDPELMRDPAGGPVGDELRDTLELAMRCVDWKPSARPEAREVLRRLEQIRPGSDGGAR